MISKSAPPSSAGPSSSRPRPDCSSAHPPRSGSSPLAVRADPGRAAAVGRCRGRTRSHPPERFHPTATRVHGAANADLEPRSRRQLAKVLTRSTGHRPADPPTVIIELLGQRPSTQTPAPALRQHGRKPRRLPGRAGPPWSAGGARLSGLLGSRRAEPLERFEHDRVAKTVHAAQCPNRDAGQGHRTRVARLYRIPAHVTFCTVEIARKTWNSMDKATLSPYCGCHGRVGAIG